jgi:hypothetical protein
MKKEAIIIGEEPQKESKGIEFTHFLSMDGRWSNVLITLLADEVVYYLGKCKKDGDMFMTKNGEHIRIYKGNLNDGTY